jgi:hypothetical protein
MFSIHAPRFSGVRRGQPAPGSTMTGVEGCYLGCYTRLAPRAKAGSIPYGRAGCIMVVSCTERTACLSLHGTRLRPYDRMSPLGKFYEVVFYAPSTRYARALLPFYCVFYRPRIRSHNLPSPTPPRTVSTELLSWTLGRVASCNRYVQCRYRTLDAGQ